jgi:hypothetical protein
MGTRFLKRYILPSDNHQFIGRIYDLSIVGMHFDSYEELSRHSDCKYVFDVNSVLSALTRRIESLNMVGEMLWPYMTPDNFKDFPLSRYDWLTVSADAFLGRYVSVVDCAIILTNGVLECGLSQSACTIASLKKKSAPVVVVNLLEEIIDDQGPLRQERNSRLHHGFERGFSSNDKMFRLGSLFEHRSSRIVVQNGRPIPLDRYFREGLVELQREFNRVMKRIVRQLDCLYDILEPQFEDRFSAKL